MMDRGTLQKIWNFVSKNKFEKLVHLVGFIIRKFVTMHGHTSEFVNTNSSPQWNFLRSHIQYSCFHCKYYIIRYWNHVPNNFYENMNLWCSKIKWSRDRWDSCVRHCKHAHRQRYHDTSTYGQIPSEQSVGGSQALRPASTATRNSTSSTHVRPIFIYLLGSLNL
jgi:hypothetical protein